jgi:Flp pilus assembly protein TadG
VPIPRLRKLHRAENGTQTVEFALLLPVLLLLIFGMIDFGRGYFSWLIITNGAREGARAASVGKPLTTISTRVQAAVTGLPVGSVTTGTCPTTAGALCISAVNVQGGSGTSVTVHVTYNFSFLVVPRLVSLVGASTLPGGAFPLRAHATMRLE